MLIGEYRHSVDEKGRVQVPVKWRSFLAAGAVVTKGFDGSLAFYPLEVWQGMAARLAALPQSQPEARAFLRQTLAGAVDVELDKLGRVLIPPYLRQYAKLSKNTVLAGLHDHFELWDETAWSEYLGRVDQDTPEFGRRLGELGI